jgi:hypothetical protein
LKKDIKFDGYITLQLQKEKEDKIQEGHHKIIEEVELQLENVKVKYDGIISKVGSIEDQAQRIEDVIVSENKMDDMGVKNEGKPSHVKPYQHPHYQESFQERQEDKHQHYQGRRWNNTSNIHGIGNSKTIIRQDIIKDQQLQQIG